MNEQFIVDLSTFFKTEKFLIGGSSFYKGQKIALLYMQSFVPWAIAIIEFGAEGDNCAVTKYKTTKWRTFSLIL